MGSAWAGQHGYPMGTPSQLLSSCPYAAQGHPETCTLRVRGHLSGAVPQPWAGSQSLWSPRARGRQGIPHAQMKGGLHAHRPVVRGTTCLGGFLEIYIYNIL